jgi:hypothetical protein
MAWTPQQVDDFMNDASVQASSWFTIFTGRPAVVPGTDPTLVALQQSAGEIPPTAIPIPIATNFDASPDLTPLVVVIVCVAVGVLLLRA